MASIRSFLCRSPSISFFSSPISPASFLLLSPPFLLQQQQCTTTTTDHFSSPISFLSFSPPSMLLQQRSLSSPPQRPPPQPVFCFVCPRESGVPREFHSRFLYEFHNDQYHPDRSHCCPLCGNRFEENLDLVAHLRSLECLLWGPLKPEWDISFEHRITNLDWEVYSSYKKVIWYPKLYEKNTFLYNLIKAYSHALIVVFADDPWLLAKLMKKCAIKGIVYTDNLSTKDDMEFAYHKLKIGTARVLICTDLMLHPSAKEVSANLGQIDILVNFDIPTRFSVLVKERLRFGIPGIAYYFFIKEDGEKDGRIEVVKEQIEGMTIAASPFQRDITREQIEYVFAQCGKVNSINLPSHFEDKRFFFRTALIEFSTEEEAENALKQNLSYAGTTLELKSKKDFDAEREKKIAEFEKSRSSKDDRICKSEMDYPKGLIVSFKLKPVSEDGSAVCENALEGGEDFCREDDAEKAAVSKNNQDKFSREDIRSVFKAYGIIKYVDYATGAKSGYIRFAEPVGAEKALAASVVVGGGLIVKNCIASLEAVSGEAEKEYWSSLLVSQENRRGGSERTMQCTWVRPKEGFHMVNCDGSLQSDSAGFGAIIRDPNGEVVAAVCGATLPHKIHVHEFQGVVAGLQLAQICGLTDVQICVDSSTVVKVLNQISDTPWSCMHLVRQVDVLRQGFRRFEVLHVYREGNKAADFLSKLRPDSGFAILDPNSFDVGLTTILDDDRRGEVYERKKS